MSVKYIILDSSEHVSRLLNKTSNLDEVVSDTDEILMFIFNCLENEETGISDLEYECLSMIHDCSGYTLIMDDFEKITSAMVEFGRIMHSYLKYMGVYVNGRLQFVFSSMCDGDIVLKHIG